MRKDKEMIESSLKYIKSGKNYVCNMDYNTIIL